MAIPTQFQLGGIVWSVEDSEHLPGAFGITNSGLAKILLLSDLPEQVKEQTFYHELVHAILFAMGKPQDQHDEVFVDGFATFLHQFSNTIEYNSAFEDGIQ
jgi:hypothetical protein